MPERSQAEHPAANIDPTEMSGYSGDVRGDAQMDEALDARSAASLPEGSEYGRARAVIAYLWPRRHTRDRLVLRWNVYEARRLRDAR